MSAPASTSEAGLRDALDTETVNGKYPACQGRWVALAIVVAADAGEVEYIVIIASESQAGNPLNWQFNDSFDQAVGGYAADGSTVKVGAPDMTLSIDRCTVGVTT